MSINRRTFLNTTAAGIGVSLIPYAHTASDLPNIVLCMADDQGWGDMGYNGHPKLHTPNFDTLAATGIKFDRFYAAAPVCSPTRGSVMTGRHPNRFGCFKWGHTLRPQEITIAEALKTKGYVTGHFGKWHIGSVQNGSPCNPGSSGFDEWFSAPNFFDNNPILSRNGEAVPVTGESSIITVDAAIEFMHKYANGDKPFLAVVWFGSPHNPHEADEKDRVLYDDVDDEKLQHFYGEITGMDRAFGKLRSAIKELGIYDNTLLWYNSDNGGLRNLGSTGGRAHKGQVYEGGLRVPALIEYPRMFSAPKTVDVPCSTVDIYPTILDWLDIEIENQTPLDGISLDSIINNNETKRSTPLGFWDYPERGISTPSRVWMKELYDTQQKGSRIHSIERLRLESGIISKQYPLTEFPGHAAWLDMPYKLHRIENENGIKWELYNLVDDPMESQNILANQPDLSGRMKQDLERWLQSVVQSLNGGDYT